MNAAGRVSAETARTLRIIAAAMAGGLALFAGVAVWFHLRAAGAVPTPEQVRGVNLLTTLAMAGAVGSILGSEILWRRLLRAPGGTLDERARAAFVARLALREGGAIFGLAVAVLAALSGILRAYPAYWANLAPFGLFVVFVAARWPSEEGLNAQIADALPPPGEGPASTRDL